MSPGMIGKKKKKKKKNSPSCANFALKHLAMSHKEEFPRSSSFLHDDFYMDDGLTSVARTEEAKTLINEAIQSCARKQIRLHKFISNEREVIQSIPSLMLINQRKPKLL